MQMVAFRAWIMAARLRTLPLSLSGIALGSFIAASEGRFNWWVFLFASFTTVLLQVLSNFANDYGDFLKGTDAIERKGPARAMQSGMLTPRAMRTALAVLIILSLFSGAMLIYLGTKGNHTSIKLFYLLLGIGAIVAAIKYTIGKKPYGYIGLGDLFVFLFFGLAGVMGTYYLHTGHFRADVLLPAASVGFLSAGVLNINNIRDYTSDMLASKRTFVVLIGQKAACYYHLFLLSGALVTGSLFTLMNFQSRYQFLFLATAPLLVQNIVAVFKYARPVELNRELKKLAFSTLLYSVSLGIGMVIPYLPVP